MVSGTAMFLVGTILAIGAYVASSAVTIVVVNEGESFEYGACCLPEGGCLELEASDCAAQVAVNGTGRFLGDSSHCTDFPAGMCYSSPCPDNTAAFTTLGHCACNTSVAYRPAVALPPTCYNVTLRGCVSPIGVCTDAEPSWCSVQSFTLLPALCLASGAGACSNPGGCLLTVNSTVCTTNYSGRTFFAGKQCIDSATNFA